MPDPGLPSLPDLLPLRVDGLGFGRSGRALLKNVDFRLEAGNVRVRTAPARVFYCVS